MVDLETSNQADERQKSPKRLLLAGLIAAAAAVGAIALVAIRDEEPAAPADQPAPTALFGTPDKQFAPGTYFVDEVDGPRRRRSSSPWTKGGRMPLTVGASARKEQATFRSAVPTACSQMHATGPRGSTRGR